jgi:transcriptional regulator with XRE-family HTH domain
MAKAREQLRHRRKQLGFTQESFAEVIGVSMTTYRDWERGVNRPRVGFRPRLARHLQVSLVELGRWIDGDGPGSAPDGFDVKDWLGHFASLEQGAGQLWAYEPTVVHGLLQTAGYATEVERRGPRPVSEAEVAKYVGLRLARQDVLDRQPEPLDLSVILDESVLYRVAGCEEVMAGQLDRLVEQAGRPTIDVRVLPFASGEFSAAFGSFTLLTAPEATMPYMAYVKDRAGPHYLDRVHEVETHMELFSYLAGVALSRDDSLDLIRAVTKERYR